MAPGPPSPLNSPVGSPRASPRVLASPQAAEALLSDENVFATIQGTLDYFHYQVMHSTMGKTWNRLRVLEAFVRVLAIHGLPVIEEDLMRYIRLDEHKMVQWLVDLADRGFRQKLDVILQDMITIIDSTVALRSAVDSGSDEKIFKAIDDEECSKMGCQLLRNSVLAASKHAEHLHKCHHTWVDTQENRVVRLMSAADIAERTRFELMAVEAQLNVFQEHQMQKSKHILMTFVSGSRDALMKSAWVAWSGVMVSGRVERNIRIEFEKEIKVAEANHVETKARQKAKAITYFGNREQQILEEFMIPVWEVWKREVKVLKREAELEEDIDDLNFQFQVSSKNRRGSMQQVLKGLGSEEDKAMAGEVMAIWMKFTAESKEEKEFEEEVKRARETLQAHLAKKRSETKALFESLMQATATGLQVSALRGWARVVKESAALSKLEIEGNQQEEKLENLYHFRKASAMAVQQQTNEQMRINTLTKAMLAWQAETKVNKVDKYYTVKIESKRKQLTSIQKLFQEFAQHLETALKDVDDDSTGRKHYSKKDMHRGMTRDGGSLSLPSIRQ